MGPQQPQRQPNDYRTAPQFTRDVTWGRPRERPAVRRRCHTGAMTQAMSRPQVELLTRDGCTICARVHARLTELAAELGFELSTTDVDAAASAGNPSLRAEFGDRLPVILLDGREHSYWEIDEPRLRADLAR
jgi:glutaredoxin